VALAASVGRGIAADCTQTSAPIETDRPDVTNSSVVVPVGSFQQENGINLSRSNNGVAFDGTNTRLRVGVAPCLEVLVDLPTYVTSFRQGVASGFTDVVPAVKWQISPIPEKFDLSTTVGLGLPTGAAVVAGSGAQPYVQFPWSLDIGGGWAITGMVTNFFTPADPMNRYTNQSTFVIERQFNERTFLFAEYVGEFPIAGGTRQRRLSDHENRADRLPSGRRPQSERSGFHLRDRILIPARRVVRIAAMTKSGRDSFWPV
jgi:hypothetical protein